jgi:uncharacterized protein (TIGR02679 family)
MNADMQLKLRRIFCDPAWERMLDQLRRLCEASVGAPRGQIRLEDADRKEREASDGFFGTYTPAPTPVIFTVRSFEKRLREYGLGDSVLKFFETLDGETLLTRGTKRIQSEESWSRLFLNIKHAHGFSFLGETISLWVEGLETKKAPGVRIIQKVFQENPVSAKSMLMEVLEGFRILGEVAEREFRNIRLPILAAQVTGDAHGLDLRYARGRLFWYGLAAQMGMLSESVKEEGEVELEEGDIDASSGTALRIRHVYRASGITDDDISSQVIVFAPSWYGEWEERILTLRHVDRWQKGFPGGDVYAIENPSIFAHLMDACIHQMEEGRSARISRERWPILVCVSGQPSVAAIRLLDQCLIGKKLFYAGDIDAKGLEIAEGFASRYPESFIPWGMSSALYEAYATHGIPWVEGIKVPNSLVHSSWDPDLPKVIARYGKKIHQEHWVDILCSDWLKAWG